MKLFIQKLRYKLAAHKRLSIGAVGAVLALIAGLVLFLPDNQSGDSNQSAVKPKPTFTNYLKPASEIKVGDYRYVSACQVLSPDDVNSIFNTMGEDGYIMEDYYDATPIPGSKLDRNIETSCRYVGEEDKDVALSTKQSYKAVDTDDLQFELYALGDEKMSDKIKLYEKAANNTNDNDLKAFVADLKQSVDIYNAQSASSKSNASIDLKKLVVPVDRGLFSFNITKDNVVYKLDYKVKKSDKDEFSLSNEEIVDGLKKSSKALQAIRTKAADARLDQSPVSTILGDTEKVGNSKVLEPCAILTSQLYQAVTGSVPNRAIGRKTTEVNITKERFAANGSPLYPDNECDRDGKTGDTSTSVRLSLNYAASAEALQAQLNKGFKIDANDKLLQTSADWAGYFNMDASTGGYVVFRTGTYYGSLSILHTKTEGFLGKQTQTGGTEQQFVQLVNAAVEYIKQQQ